MYLYRYFVKKKKKKTLKLTSFLFLSGKVLPMIIDPINRFTPSLTRKLFTQFQKKKKKINEKKIKNQTIDSLIVTNCPSAIRPFSTKIENRQSSKLSFIFVAQPFFVAGATPSAPSRKSGESSRGRSWGTSVPFLAQIEVALPWPGVAERIENPRNRSRRRGG